MAEPTSGTDKSGAHSCPDCGKAMQLKQGKRGPFWGCSGFPECKTTRNDVDGRPSTKLDEQTRCPLCTRQLLRASQERGGHWFCSGYDKGCKVRLADKDGRPETAYRCPDCGNLLVQRTGKHGPFWGCKRYPECRASYSDVEGRPDIDIFTTEST